MKWRQVAGHAAFWPVVVLLLWWMLTPALPRLPNPKPGLESRVREALQKIAADCTTAEEAKAKVQEWSHLWSDGLNRYTVEIKETEDGWILVAEPDRESVHQNSPARASRTPHFPAMVRGVARRQRAAAGQDFGAAHHPG